MIASPASGWGGGNLGAAQPLISLKLCAGTAVPGLVREAIGASNPMTDQQDNKALAPFLAPAQKHLAGLVSGVGRAEAMSRSPTAASS